MAHGSRLKRGAFRPALSRLVNLLRAGPVDAQYQGASFRFYHQASATERGALFNPDYNLEELDFLRARVSPGGTSSMSEPMSAPTRWRWRVMSAPAARSSRSNRIQSPMLVLLSTTLHQAMPR